MINKTWACETCGMVKATKGATYCPHCKPFAIRKEQNSIINDRLDRGLCLYCGKERIEWNDLDHAPYCSTYHYNILSPINTKAH